MRRGDFAAAWEISDAVLQARVSIPCWHLPRHEQHLWNGHPFAGKRVLIHCYHGLGDTVQFIRYAALVRKTAREVAVWAQPALVNLLRTVPGIDQVLPLHDGQPPAGYDLDVETMELPHLFRSTLADLPAQIPYLHPAPGEPPPGVNEPDLYRVGLVWQAGDWDVQRSVPLGLLAALGEIPGVRLHALQRGRALSEWRGSFGRVSGSDDVETTARVMRALGLVISVDSFPAHLAGALGCPVWTLLHAAPDWRWLEARDDSPWYPTMRLFRQERAGGWEPVVARVAGELRKVLAQTRAGTAPVAGAKAEVGEA